MQRLKVMTLGFGLTACLSLIMLFIVVSLMVTNNELRRDVERLEIQVRKNRDMIDGAERWGVYVGTKLEVLGIEVPRYPSGDDQDAEAAK